MELLIGQPNQCRACPKLNMLGSQMYDLPASPQPFPGPRHLVGLQRGTATLFFDEVPAGSRRTKIADNVDLANGAYTWTPPHLAPGRYYLFAGINNVGSFVVNDPPAATLLNPTFTSGPDYATTVVGNPWDMNSATDILQTHNVTGLKFVNGIASAYSEAGSDDPELIFNGPQLHPIDLTAFTTLPTACGTRCRKISGPVLWRASSGATQAHHTSRPRPPRTS